MKGYIERIRNWLYGKQARLPFPGGLRLAAATALAVVCLVFCPGTAWAVDAGTYLVTVTPSYTDPESGKVEDPGNNEAIGQGMTQKLCGPQGLLEVDADGNMYLTVRYYLSQFVSDVSFEERNGGSYTSRAWEKMQVKDPVSGSSNLDEKYGYTDYRIPIQSLDSVFRGKAYIEPMGRNVVYFFQASAPVAGSGDFVTSLRQEAAEPETEPQTEREADYEGMEDAGDYEEYEAGEPENREELFSGAEQEEPAVRTQTVRDGEINGSGDADAPVTGIPEKPKKSNDYGDENGAADGSTYDVDSSARTIGSGYRAGNGESDYSAGNSEKDYDASGATGNSGSAETYALNTRYDLSAVPLEEAKKLTRPMLDAAVGITQTVGDFQAPESAGRSASDSAENSADGSRRNANKTIMLVLLAVSAVLLVRFLSAFRITKRQAERVHAPGYDGRTPENTTGGEAERQDENQ